jgi:excisionase family DNA binding protein
MLKSAEVCRMLNIDPSTLYRWRRDNHNLAFYRVGGQVRYRESDVLAYLGGGRHDPEEHHDDNPAKPGPE